MHGQLALCPALLKVASTGCVQTVEDLPEPTSPLVKLRQHPEAFYAVDIFGGRRLLPSWLA